MTKIQVNSVASLKNISKVSAGELRASIDQGSASTKLLIQRRTASGWETVLDKKISTKLGLGVENGGALPLENCERALAALRQLLQLATDQGISACDIPLIATAVVRNSSNGQAFLKNVQALGLNSARVLSGQEEAALGYAGAVAQFGTSKTRFATVDLGGGSFQLAVGEGLKFSEGGSTQVGSNFILRNYLPARVLTISDFEFADDKLKKTAPMPLATEMLKGRTLIATGGTPKLLASHFGTQKLSQQTIDAFRKTLGALEPHARGNLLQAGKTPKQMEALGIDTDQGAYDYGVKLPASTTLLLHLMRALKVDEVEVSKTDARHALIALAEAR